MLPLTVSIPVGCLSVLNAWADTSHPIFFHASTECSFWHQCRSFVEHCGTDNYETLDDFSLCRATSSICTASVCMTIVAIDCTYGSFTSLMPSRTHRHFRKTVVVSMASHSLARNNRSCKDEYEDSPLQLKECSEVPVKVEWRNNLHNELEIGRFSHSGKRFTMRGIEGVLGEKLFSSSACFMFAIKDEFVTKFGKRNVRGRERESERKISHADENSQSHM